jgi:hypothetical protein
MVHYRRLTLTTHLILSLPPTLTISLGMLIGSARGAVYDRQDWREERGRIVDDTLCEFRAVARRHLGRSRRRLALDAID